MPHSKILLFLIILAAILGITKFILVKFHVPSARVCFSSGCVIAELSLTDSEKSRGLMFRKELGEHESMLFAYKQNSFPAFWMKNTLIPLDIIWIGDNGLIVHIEKASPCLNENCPLYQSLIPARFVLETNQNYASQNHIQIGDPVQITVSI